MANVKAAVLKFDSGGLDIQIKLAVEEEKLRKPDPKKGREVKTKELTELLNDAKGVITLLKAAKSNLEGIGTKVFATCNLLGSHKKILEEALKKAK